MAYLTMTQQTIKFLNKDFNEKELSSYQKLIKLFGELFSNEKEFLKNPSDRMGLSHYVENFLRRYNFQTVVTIKDLNLIFNNNANYDINDIELYKVFFVLIYEELSSNDPQISHMIKNVLFKLINLIDKNNDVKIEIPKKIEKENIELPKNNIVKNEKNNFIIHNKNYLREYIIQNQLLPYKCNNCGLTEWQNQFLKLELDSINGEYNNININNLRLLCPNCYSQIGYMDDLYETT